VKQFVAATIFNLLLLALPAILAAEEVTFYHTDNFGTPMAMTDATGNVVWRADELPFGEEYQTEEIPEQNNRRFLGKELDKETGLIYMGARYMDPKTGRFNRPDPVGLVNPTTGKVNREMLVDPQRHNRYVYGLNNPYRYVDPDGLDPVESGELSAIKKEAQDVAARCIQRSEQFVDFAEAAGSAGITQGAMGRFGKQQRLRGLANDPKLGKADRGWINNETRHIKNGNRKAIRLPGNSRNSKQEGKVLAHPRGKRAKDGFGYEHAKIQDTDLHKLEHKHEGY